MRGRRNTHLTISPPAILPSAEKLGIARPPLSPLLPFPLTKENRSRSRHTRSFFCRIFILFCCCVLAYRVVLGRSQASGIFIDPQNNSSIPALDHAVSPSDLPRTPSAVFVTDKSGERKWTLSIPHRWTFPLPGHYYQDMCVQGAALRQMLTSEQPTSSTSRSWLGRLTGDNAEDRLFMDVGHAQSAGALPQSVLPSAKNVCAKSMTFVLGGEDASLGKSLMQLWLSYGIAQKERRAFFIDDSQWAWGKFTTFFLSPPDPQCAPPQAHEILPYPRSARHLVVSSATAPWTFGAAFEDDFLVPRRHGCARQQKIFSLLRTGFQALFRLSNTDDVAYAMAQISDLKETSALNNQPVIGMHVRRGDLRPYELQFSGDYLPLERFADAAEDLVRSLSPKSASVPNAAARPALLVASDDPTIIDSADLRASTSAFTLRRAQDRITLATKALLDQTAPVASIPVAGGAYVKHIDENAGWEGGFFPGLFFSLGQTEAPDIVRRGSLSHSPSTSPIHSVPVAVADDTVLPPLPPPPVPAAALQMRELVGRAYLLDLAVLANAADAIVCASSSASCRLLAVALGWDKVQDGRWRNVDDHRPWSWDGNGI